MSWKAGLSRYLSHMRFFACPDSPSSRGILTYYAKNHEHLMQLNPEFQLMLRTTENAMPAITTDLDWKVPDLLKFMIQTGRFRDLDGSISQARVEAAKSYLNLDFKKINTERYRSPKFDPERPNNDELFPGWKEDPKIMGDLKLYFQLKKEAQDLLLMTRSGPNEEYTRAKNSLLMCQRVDLWCAGEKEVEAAVLHLYKIGRAKNEYVCNFPSFIHDFWPGVRDFEDS